MANVWGLLLRISGDAKMKANKPTHTQTNKKQTNKYNKMAHA
jgi:hypothetical protein